MSKTMTASEFASWAETHTLAEVEQRARDLQDGLVSDLIESEGVDREVFDSASPSQREMAVEAAAQNWIDDQEPEPVGTSQFEFGNDLEDGIDIELPGNSKVAKMLDRGLVSVPFADDSPEAGEVAQAIFAATHPFVKSVENANLLRDRVERNGGTYFTAENLDQAFRELVFEGAIEIPDSFFQS